MRNKYKFINLKGIKIQQSSVKEEANSSNNAAAPLMMMVVTIMTITQGFLGDSFYTHTSDLFLSSALPLKSSH